MKKLTLYLSVITGILFFMSSCEQQKGTESKTSDQKPSSERSELTAKTENSATADTVRLEITANDQMKFSEQEINIKAGQVVVLTLKHIGELPVTSMGHNWVLLKPGADMQAFAQDAIQAKENDYIPQERKDDIIAHTKMLGGGELDTITFKAPRKGTYTFLCSFPGHYMAMNGKFIVE